MPQAPALPPASTIARQRVTSDGLDPRLVTALGACRSRWRAQSGTAGLLSSLTVMLAVLLGGLVVGRSVLDSTPDTRWLLFGLVTGTTALAMVVRVLWPLVRAIPFRAVASDVENHCPDTRGYLISAVELGARVEDATQDSLEMRFDVQRRAGEAAERVTPAAVYPLSESPTRRALKPLAILIVAHVAVAFLLGPGYVDGLRDILLPAATPVPVAGSIDLELPGGVLARGDDLEVVARVRGVVSRSVVLHLESALANGDQVARAPMAMLEREPGVYGADVRAVKETLEIYVSAGALQSERRVIRVGAPPVVVSFDKRITPPEYLGGEPVVLRESHGDLQVLEGSSVDIRIETSQELAAAHMALEFDDESRQELPLEVNGTTASKGDFVVARSCRYRVVLTALETALVNRWSPRFEIRVDQDLPPVVSIEGPEPESLVRADGSFDIRVNASDDIGIASVTQRVAVNEESVAENEIIPGDDARAFERDESIDCSIFSLETGDRVSVSYRVRDRKGNFSDSRELSVRVYREGALLARTDLVEHYRQAAAQLRGLHRGAVNLSAMWEQKLGQPGAKRRVDARQAARNMAPVRQRIQSWIDTAEACLGQIEQALAASQDTTTRADLWWLHARLGATLEEHARLVAVILEEMESQGDEPPLVEDVPRVAFELWQAARARVESLARKVVPLLADHEFVAGVHDTLVRVSTRIDEDLKRRGREQHDFDGTLFELASQLRSAVTFPEDLIDGAAGRKVLKQVRAECERLLESIEVTGRRSDAYDRKILALDVQQTLKGVARNMGTFRKAASEVRKNRSAWPSATDGADPDDAGDNAAIISRFVEKGRQTLPRWETVLTRALRHLEADPAVGTRDLIALLDGVLENRDPRIRGADWSWRTPVLRQRASWTRAAVEAQDSLAARYAHDLFVLDRVFRVIEERAVENPLRNFINGVRNQNRAAALGALGALLEDRSYRDANLDQLENVARAVGVLELSRILGTVHSQARELVELDENREHAVGALRQRYVVLCRVFLSSLDGLEKAAIARHVTDLETAVRRIRDSVETRILRKNLRVVENDDLAAGDQALRFRQALTRVENRLALLAAEETPSIHAARASLRGMLGDTGSDLKEIAGRARRSHEETQALQDALDSAAAARVEEELSRLYDQETQIEKDIEHLREALASEAASLDLADSDNLRRARDLDAAALALEDSSPPISDVLLAASAHEDFREEALQRILPRQRERLENLSRLEEHFSRDPSDPGSSDHLARQLGVEDELDQLYRDVESIRDMKEEQTNLADDAEKIEGEEDEKLDRLTRQQKDLQDRVAETLEQSRDGQAALDNLLEKSLESLRDEIDAHRDSQIGLNGERQQEAVELRSEQSRIRSGVESLERDVARVESDDLDRLERQLRRDSPKDAEAIRTVRDDLGRVKEDLRQAKEELREKPDDALAKLSRGEQQLADVRRKVEAAFERIDPAASQMKSTSSDTEAQRDRAGAIREIDALRHRERGLARVKELRSNQRMLEDRDLLDRQAELRQEQVRIAALRSGEQNEEERVKLEKEGRAAELELERLNQIRNTVQDDRATEDAEAHKARERLARDVNRTAGILEGTAEKLGESDADAQDLSRARTKLTSAGQRLESDSRIRVHQELDDALAALGVERGAAAERVDATAMSRDLLDEFTRRGRRLRQQLDSLEDRERRSRKDLIDRENALRGRLRQSHDRLERIEELRALDESETGDESETSDLGEVDLDAARRQFTEEVLPRADRAVEWLETDSGRLHAEDSPHLDLDDRDPGRQLVDALDRLRRTIRKSGQDRASRGKPGPGRPGDAKKAPGRESAKDLGEALERMARASSDLREKRPEKASGHQRSASDALDRALRAAAQSMKRGKASESSEDRSASQPGQSDDSGVADSATDDESRASNGLLDRELLEALFGKDSKESRRWYLLPSDLKREILMGKRENIPPRYRERVEEYYRRVAQAAGEE